MLTIAFAGVTLAMVAGMIVTAILWWSSERRAKQLLETISVSSYHNDEFRNIARRERKYAALKALGELLP